MTKEPWPRDVVYLEELFKVRGSTANADNDISQVDQHAPHEVL